MPSPTKKPTSLKMVAGTARKDREGPESAGVELPPLADVPAPPSWLPNAHAVREWERLAPILVANRLLTEAGLSALGTLCALHGKLVQLWTAGETPNAAMLGQYRASINDFGLTPAAQGKVRPMGEAPAQNPFAKNGQRSA